MNRQMSNLRRKQETMKKQRLMENLVIKVYLQRKSQWVWLQTDKGW